MQNAASGGIAIEPRSERGRNDAYHSVVSDLVSLIDHVQASLMLIESAIARETRSAARKPPPTSSCWMTSRPPT